MKNLIFVALGAVLLTACALPMKQAEPVSFVSGEEQAAIQYIREGNQYFREGRFVQAELKYLLALELFPEAENVKVNLINSQIKSAQFDLAWRGIRELLKEAPDDVDLHLLKSKLEIAEYDYVAAAQTLNYSLALAEEQEIVPYQLKIHQNLATLLFLMGEEERALCEAANAFQLKSLPEDKARYARLSLAQGMRNFNQTLPVEVARILPTEAEFIEWLLYSDFIQANYEAARERIAQLKLINKNSTLLSPEVELVQYLLSELEPQDPLNSDETAEEMTREEVFQALIVDDEISANIALYWPAKLLTQLVQFKDELLLRQIQ